MISVLAYAKMRGVSHVAVIKAIRAGRLVKCVAYNDKGQPKITDPVLADQEWNANTDAAQQRKPAKESAPAKPASKPTKQAEKPTKAAPPEAPPEQPANLGSGGPTYAQSRAVREAYQARLSKLEYEEKAGKLLHADAVRVTMFNAARKCRDMLMGVPDRIAPLVVGLNDQHEIHRLLTDEVRRVCAEIAAIKPPENANG